MHGIERDAECGGRHHDHCDDDNDEGPGVVAEIDVPRLQPLPEATAGAAPPPDPPEPPPKATAVACRRAFGHRQ